MFSVVELVSLYGEINQVIIDKRMDSTSRYFKKATALLQEIKNKMHQITLIKEDKD